MQNPLHLDAQTSNSLCSVPNASDSERTVGMVFQLADGTIQTCNSAAESILGFTLEQMQHRTSLDELWQTIHADGSAFPGEEHPVMVALRTGQPVTGVVMGIYQPMGTLEWITVDAQPLFQGSSLTPWAVVATFWPIPAPQGFQVASAQGNQPLSIASFKRTVLLVEDCAEDREMMRRYLQAQPEREYEILEAETAAVGLEIFQTTPLDLLILDYSLPDCDAIEFLVNLHGQYGNACPVVVVTGKGSEEIAVQLLKAGVTDYLVKGQIQARDLQVAVDSAITQSQLTQQLQRSLGKERLISQIAQRIHRSLNLDDVLHATVWEVRQFLQTDRVLIFRFDPGLETGQVLVEAVEAPWPALLSTSFQDPCFVQNYAQLYRQGRVTAIPDVEGANNLEPCYREFLNSLHVQANLVVPILRDDGKDILWGLLVAQHCIAPRVWQWDEIDLLQQLATQLGIALHRAELYFQAQSELATRRLIEHHLQDSQNRLQLGIQVAGVALAKFTYATNTVELSPEAAALYGIASDELVVSRDRIHSTFHPDDYDELMEVIAIITDPAGSGWFAHQHRVVWPNGEVRWLSVRQQVFFDRSGAVPRPDHAILAAIDVTDAKQAEATVQQQLAQIESIYATAPIGLCFIDRDRRFVQMNDRLAEINRLPISAQIGRTVAEVLPKLAELQEPIFKKVLETGEPVLDIEFQGMTPAQPGLERHWLMSYYPLKLEEGQILGINIMVQEITNRKRAEVERNRLLAETQAAREAAEAANRSKDEFVAVVAHELRSPLNSIAGWAKLLQTRNFDEKTKAKAVDTIWRNTQVQVQLVEDLLDISRMVRGSLQLTIGPVNLTTVVEAAINLVTPQAQAKEIQIDSQLTILPPFQGDFSRLQQIVVNLLTNAIKFTPTQGRVYVQLKQVDAQAQIRIHDTGKGIAPEFLPRIFDQYKQGQKNTGSKDGLGLGLAIVKNLVELHHGTITADSEGLGNGATFTVWLPLPTTPVLQPVRSLPEDNTTSLAGIRLLVVDDEPDMLNLITFVLKEAGAKVQSATGKLDALARLSSFKPELLISDIAMPDGSGYDLIEQIRTQPDGQIPAIALTAYASTTYQERSLQAGFQQHLTKPVEPEVLVATIASLIRENTGNGLFL